MDSNKLIVEFLVAYCKSYDWPYADEQKVLYRLCAEGQYSPNAVTQCMFLKLAYGWFWGKTGDDIEANSCAGILKLKLDEQYANVAKRFNW